MLVSSYSSSAQINAQIAQKYAQLDKLDLEESVSNFKSSNRIELSQTPKNYDEQDYLRVLEKFKQKDAQIRTHEQTHASQANTTTPISYNYQVGPDGKLYAVGGYVRLDTSMPKDPQEALYKLDRLQSATTSVKDMSGADAQIAQTAHLNKMLISSKLDQETL